MSKDPAILFYTGDFLNGCIDLTFEERGQYITLLCLQHQKGHLSEKTIRLSVGSVSDDVMKKFSRDPKGNFYHERMDDEIEKRMQFVQSRIDNGLKGGRPKKPNAKPNAKPNGKANKKLSENENRNKNIIEDLYKGVVIFFDEDLRPKTEKQKEDWCGTLEKLIRIDGHSPEHIQNIIKRTRMDDFWRPNFLSVLKLRKKDKDQIMYFTKFEKKINNVLTNGKQPGATVAQLTDVVSRNFGSGQ